ncbi:hypothetical protein M885DRAFT_612626 [Pelagophyceae sp. CCMP2097]|nr:hypothetical protein M885DRAFT_612626 [Pelagophyceae sp. CCMP2097]
MDEAAIARIFEEQTTERAPAISALEAQSTDFRALELPLARIKKIMKIEDEVQGQLGEHRFMISQEAPVLFAKACELFVIEMTARAWTQTEESKRRTLQRADVARALSKSDMYDFLIDILPRDEPKPHLGDNEDPANELPGAQEFAAARALQYTALQSAAPKKQPDSHVDELQKVMWQQKLAAHMRAAEVARAQHAGAVHAGQHAGAVLAAEAAAGGGRAPMPQHQPLYATNPQMPIPPHQPPILPTHQPMQQTHQPMHPFTHPPPHQPMHPPPHQPMHAPPHLQMYQPPPRQDQPPTQMHQPPTQMHQPPPQMHQPPPLHPPQRPDRKRPHAPEA